MCRFFFFIYFDITGLKKIVHFTKDFVIHRFVISRLHCNNVCFNSLYPSRGMGGGGTPFYKLYRYVPPHQVGFLHHFGLKTGIHIAILVWNRVWFSGELRECMKVFIISIPNE